MRWGPRLILAALGAMAGLLGCTGAAGPSLSKVGSQGPAPSADSGACPTPAARGWTWVATAPEPVYRPSSGGPPRGAAHVSGSRGWDYPLVVGPGGQDLLTFDSDGLWTSHDCGRTWTGPVWPGEPDVQVREKHARSATPIRMNGLGATPSLDRLYAATDWGVWMSKDQGGTWTPIASGGTYYRVVVAPSRPEVIYVCRDPVFATSKIDAPYILRSLDYGTSWEGLDFPLPICVFTLDWGDPPKLYRLQDGKDPAGNILAARSLCRSYDLGNTCDETALFAEPAFIRAIGPDGSLWFSMRGLLARTLDEGRTVSELPLPFGGSLRGVAVDPANAEDIYVLSSESEIWRYRS